MTEVASRFREGNAVVIIGWFWCFGTGPANDAAALGVSARVVP